LNLTYASTTGVGGVYAYTYRKTLTIDTTTSGANIGALTAFPICVVVNSSSWTNSTERSHFFNDTYNPLGKRVQFFDADGTTNLAYEVESYDAATQVAVYWVKKSVASNSTTDHIHVGYGNDPNGAAQDAATSVWDSNFGGVWHGGLTDSTSIATTLTNNQTASVAGIVSSGSAFDGVDDFQYSTTINAALKPATTLTVETWAKFETTGVSRYLCALQPSGAGNDGRGWVLDIGATNGFRFLIGDAGGTFRIATGGTAFTTTGVWHYVVGTYDGTTVRVYVDGLQDGSTAGSTTISYANKAGYGPTPPALVFGVAHNANPTAVTYAADQASRFKGTLDEVRISAVARTADWLKAEYFSMKTTSFNGDGWLTWSGEQVN